MSGTSSTRTQVLSDKQTTKAGNRIPEAHRCSVRLHSKPVPNSDLEIKSDPNGGVVTGVYFTAHPSVNTTFNELAGDGW